MSRAIPLLLIIGALTVGSSCTQEMRATVGVAASLRGVMPEVARAYEETTGASAPLFSFGASGTLAKQLEAGAPLDGVVLASETDVYSLVSQGLLEPRTRAVLARNTLVLAGRQGESSERLSELSRAERTSRIAIGDPRFVAAGEHARAALVIRDLWEKIAHRAIFTRDVTAAVALLRRGEVNHALIYDTDVRRQPELRVIETIRAPRQPVVIAARAPHAQRLSAFYAFLKTSRSATIFEEHGFEVSTP